MAIPHYCKRCFRALRGKDIPDSLLLMSSVNTRCDSCGTDTSVVLYYFKYGEHTVTPDGKRMKDVSRHVGVNPNYSFFGNESIYPPHEQKKVESEEL